MTEEAVSTVEDSVSDKQQQPKKQRQLMSTPLQVMAAVERHLTRLSPEQVAVVLAWVNATYGQKKEVQD